MARRLKRVKYAMADVESKDRMRTENRCALEQYRRFYEAVYNSEDQEGYGRLALGRSKRRQASREPTIVWMNRLELPRENCVVLELGCGVGWLRDVHPGWVGLEYSLRALRRLHEVDCDWDRVNLRAPVGNRLINGDMQRLPLKENSVDAVFSWAALEHVPQPQLVLSEIERVLKPRGVAILAPAWNCRRWTVKHLQIRSYRQLDLLSKLEKLTIRVRNLLVWRAMCALPKRLKREIMAVVRGTVCFDYVRLWPELKADGIHITDDDAFASIDPHSAIMYFKSRNWAIPSHPGFFKRMTSRHEPVVVRRTR